MKYRLNKEKGIVEFDNGTSMPVPKEILEDINLSPRAKNLGEESYKREQDYYKDFPEAKLATSKINPAKNLVDSAEDYVRAGVSSFKRGEGQEDKGFFNRLADNYVAINKGRLKAKHEIQNQNPKASTLATILGLPGELVATQGMPGVAAAPLLGFLNSEKSLLRNPGEVGVDLGKDALIGGALDVAVRGLGKFSGMRRRRALMNEMADSGAQARQAALNEGANAVETQAARVRKEMGAHAIPTDAANAEKFIVDNIHTSQHVGTKEAKEAENFLLSILHQGGKKELNGENIERIYNALERKIANKETPEVVRTILSDFKTHLSDVLPDVFAHVKAHGKHASKAVRQIVSHIEDSLLPTITDPLIGKNAPQWVDFQKSLTESLEQVVTQAKAQFGNKISNGELANELVEAIRNDPQIKNIIKSIQRDLGPEIATGPKQGMNVFSKPMGKNLLSESQKVGKMRLQNELKNLPDSLRPRIEKTLSKINTNLATENTIASNQLGQRLQNMEGTVPPLPAVAPPPNTMERLADALNNINVGNAIGTAKRSLSAHPLRSSLSAGGVGTAAALGQFAGLPVAKAALGAAGAVGAAKTLTSPALFRTLEKSGSRLGMVQRDIENIRHAVDDMARQLPSYSQGVLSNPAERRLLSNQIETLPIPIEDKAVLQTRIRRGQPLQ